jgi:ribosome maturation factor RimP
VIRDATRFSALIEPVLRRMGYELWGIEYRPQSSSALLRIFIDKPDGVTLDDCGRVSQQVSGLLDVEDPIATRYTLEVSSPGMDRPLMKPEHFSYAVGLSVRIRLNRLVEGRRRLHGVVLDSSEDWVDIEEGDGTRLRVPLEAVESARVDPGSVKPRAGNEGEKGKRNVSKAIRRSKR